MDAVHLIAEERILASQREGVFDNLAGAGRQLLVEERGGGSMAARGRSRLRHGR